MRRTLIEPRDGGVRILQYIETGGKSKRDGSAEEITQSVFLTLEEIHALYVMHYEPMKTSAGEKVTDASVKGLKNG